MFLSQPLLAIDIGSSSVKVAEVVGSGRSKKLKSLGLELIPPGVIGNDEILNSSLLLKILRKLFHAQGIKTKGRKVALSLCGISVIYKRISILPDDETELGEQIFEEAKQQFHHDMSDMYFRFQKIDSRFASGGEETYLIVAGKIDLIEQYIELVHKLGMKVAVIDTDAFSLFNIYCETYALKGALVLLANIGAASTQVILCHEREYLFSREFFVGGNQVTARIADELNIDLNTAENLKISASTGDQSVAKKILPAVRAANEQIISEISQSVSFFLQHENVGNFSELNQALISGGGSLTFELASSMSSALQCPVQIVNPFQRIDPSKTRVPTEYLLSHGSIYAVSVGLALRKPKKAS